MPEHLPAQSEEAKWHVQSWYRRDVSLKCDAGWLLSLLLSFNSSFQFSLATPVVNQIATDGGPSRHSLLEIGTSLTCDSLSLGHNPNPSVFFFSFCDEKSPSQLVPLVTMAPHYVKKKELWWTQVSLMESNTVNIFPLTMSTHVQIKGSTVII